MNVIQSILMGVIQGLTEFIPVSSTAHLTIAGEITGLISLQQPERWTAFIATIQLGTLLAVLVYFAKDIDLIVRSFFKENLRSDRKKFKGQSMHSRLGWLIIIGSIPIILIGFTLKKVIEGTLTKSPVIIAMSLIILGIILAAAEITAKFRKDMEKISWLDSVLIGLAQCLALFPGASRSGTTLTAGLFLGLKRDVAARFSFLLSIPAVFASGLYEFYKSMQYISSGDVVNLGVATLCAAISGYASIAFLLKYLKTNSTYLFVFYRILFGIIILLFLMKGVI